MPRYLHPRLPKSKTRFEAALKHQANVAYPITQYTCILQLQVPPVLLLQQSQKCRLHTTVEFVQWRECTVNPVRCQRAAVCRYFASMAHMGYSGLALVN